MFICKFYNSYVKKHHLKLLDRNYINFRNAHPPKTEEIRKEDKHVTCYECGKSCHYRRMCHGLDKKTNNKKEFYKMKYNHTKDRQPISLGKKKIKILLIQAQVQLWVNLLICDWWSTRKKEAKIYMILILILNRFIINCPKLFEKWMMML